MMRAALRSGRCHGPPESMLLVVRDLHAKVGHKTHHGHSLEEGSPSAIATRGSWCARLSLHRNLANVARSEHPLVSATHRRAGWFDARIRELSIEVKVTGGHA